MATQLGEHVLFSVHSLFLLQEFSCPSPSHAVGRKKEIRYSNQRHQQQQQQPCTPSSSFTAFLPLHVFLFSPTELTRYDNSMCAATAGGDEEDDDDDDYDDQRERRQLDSTDSHPIVFFLRAVSFLSFSSFTPFSPIPHPSRLAIVARSSFFHS